MYREVKKLRRIEEDFKVGYQVTQNNNTTGGS